MRQWVKVWKRKEKKTSSPTSLRILLIYREPLSSFFSSLSWEAFPQLFFLPPIFQSVHFRQTSPFFFSVALNYRLAFRVTFQVIFFDWLLEWLFKSYFSSDFRVTFQVIQYGIILERFPQSNGYLIQWSGLFYPEDFVVDSPLAQFLTVPRNVLKKATLSATQPVIFSVCHKLLLQQHIIMGD